MYARNSWWLIISSMNNIFLHAVYNIVITVWMTLDILSVSDVRSTGFEYLSKSTSKRFKTT